jgi:phosphoglycerate dehydrogenase-like enzyme
VILNVTGNSKTLPDIINHMPFVVWIHSITAGVDHLLCPEITDNEEIILTNAKGVFSPSLAEYTMGAILHFAKNVPRLMKQQQEKKWNKFCLQEVRGTTMGIVGYGNIGQACARLAKSFGMKVIGLRRNPSFSSSERLLDEVSILIC